MDKTRMTEASVASKKSLGQRREHSPETSIVDYCDGFMSGVEWADKNAHWHSVHDKHPEIIPCWGASDELLIYAKHVFKDRPYMIVETGYMKPDGTWYNTRWERCEVSHWMPIPRPPEGGEQ